MGEACPKVQKGGLPASVRQRVHEATDRWLDSMEPLLQQEHPPSLMDLSEHVLETRRQLLGESLQAVVEHILEDYCGLSQADCPSCGRRLFRKRFEPKQLSTQHGSFVVKRPYFYCQDCREGHLPLDEAIEMAREAHQYDVQKKITRLAAKMPYEEAVETFRDLTGVSVGEHFAHETLNRVGESAALETVIPDREEIQRRIDKAMARPRDRPVMVVAADGAHAPIRPQGGRREKRGPGYWREAKGFRIFLTDSQGRITPLASWHQIENAEELSRDLAFVARRIPQERVRIALLGDGACWVWNALVENFPQGRQVLDYFHCAEHVWKVAHAQYDEHEKAQQWAEATLARLSLDKASDVIGGLKRMLPKDYAAHEEIEKLIRYIENNRHRLGYEARCQEGLPIGSGGIESANKMIIHTRLKRSGAWWLETNGNTMLRLRCAIYNGTFDRVFKNYVTSKRRHRR